MKVSALVAVAALLLASCRKGNDMEEPSIPPVLAVKLGRPYLQDTDIDSAFVIFKKGGHEQRIKMNVLNDSLSIGMEQLQDGPGELLIHIYSNKKYSNQYAGQWVMRKNVTLNKKASMVLDGPVSFYDPGWMPRVRLTDAVGHEAIVALRPDDPYFLVKDPGHAIYRLRVDRGYWKTQGGIALAGRAIWECFNSCTGVPDTDFFKMLPGRISNKPWNHISIAILFEINADGEGWVLSLEHEP